MENFLQEAVPNDSPYLIYAEPVANDPADSIGQIFVVLNQDILLECSKLCDHDIFTSSVVTLLAVYFAFNLEYEDKRKHLFKFLEEHILGITPKCKTYMMKKVENTLLAKLNKQCEK